ncbi:MAG TPA: S8 family serine peptidase [Anaerohalosphaeraceae bacterium]|nr:S8 family serine peptidase [Anaerohalosphaeraceae bacterium]
MSRIISIILLTSVLIGLLGVTALVAQEGQRVDFSLPPIPEIQAEGDNPSPSQDEVTAAPEPQDIEGGTFVAVGDNDRYPGTLAGKRYHVCEDGTVEQVIDTEDKTDWRYGKIHPRLLVDEIGKTQKKVLIKLQNGFAYQAAEQVRLNYQGSIDTLGDQIRQKIRQHQQLRTRLGAEESVDAELDPYPRQLRDELVTMHQQLDRQLDQMRTQSAQAIHQQMAPRMDAVRQWLQMRQCRINSESALAGCFGSEMSPEDIEAAAQLADIESLTPDSECSYDLDQSNCMFGTSGFWNAGYDGGAYDVAIIDSGVRETHTYLKYRNPPLNNPRDIYKKTAGYSDSHGTRTAGVVASTHSTYKGVAFGLDKLFDARSGSMGTSMASIDWVLNHSSGDAPEAINHSFSYYDYDDEFGDYERFLDAVVYSMGTMVTKSAGNSGLVELGYPQSANVISVANLIINDTCTASDDVIRSSSSRGPTDSGRRKPDITAPGYDTWSTDIASNTAFANHGGTSAAAPHVAGAVLLLQDAGVATPIAQKAILINTATTWSDNDTLDTYGDDGPVGGDRWDNSYGWGVMNLAHANLHRTDYFIDSVVPRNDTPAADDYKLYKGYMYSNEKATVVWNRRVVYNGSSNPTTYYSTTDINVRAYDESTGSQFDSDLVHGGNNVHQISTSTGRGVVIKVYCWSSSIDGASAETFALATEENFDRVSPPSFSTTLTMPSLIYFNTQFVVKANITNNGGVMAQNVSANLTLPAGFTLISGTDPQNVGDIQAGQTAQATWTVQSGGSSGTSAISVAVSSSCYAETYTGSASRNITVSSTALPNLTYTTETGWSYPIVPRNIGGSGGTDCLITDTLPGNTDDTYFNWVVRNAGSVAAGAYQMRLYVDDRLFDTASLTSHPATHNYRWLNQLYAGDTITGGRHTVSYWLDVNDNVGETNETDNEWARQFIWSPYALSDDTPLLRNAPPVSDGGWDRLTGTKWYNNDGFSFVFGYSGSNKWWSAVGILPAADTANYDLRLWDIGSYTGSQVGFGGGYLEYSTYGGSASDFVIVNDNKAASGTYYAGVINANGASSQYRIEESTSLSLSRRPGTEWNGSYVKATTNVLDMYEVYLPIGTYYILLDQTAGSCDLGMSLYDQSTVTARKNEYITDAYANNLAEGADESFQLNITTAGFYGLAVWKVDSSDYNKSATYRIAVGNPAVKLLSPNGGEVIPANTSRTITWDNFGNLDHTVRLELSRNNGTTWTPIVNSTDNDGSYTWNVPLPSSTQCLVRVTSTADASYTDVSDAVFTIDGSGIPADIHVRQDASDIPTGGGFDFERVNLGFYQEVEFTIDNLGGVNLNLTGSPRVQVTGADAASFVVTAQPATPIGSMESKTFTIRFTPAATRTYLATVQIASSDPDENPYTFALKGIGSLPLTFYVDDDAPSDPGPDNPGLSDPLEDGSSGHPFDMIQEAIDAAFHADTVIVRIGTYNENINLLGKNITVESTNPLNWTTVANTRIDAKGIGTVVTFASGETSQCILSGFTIRNGGGTEVTFVGIPTVAGGGVFAKDSNPTIANSIIAYNNAELGGGIYASNADIDLLNCHLYRNRATNYHGGGLYLTDGSNVSIETCKLYTNTAVSAGGGIAIQTGSNAGIDDCDIYLNTADSGGGVYVANSGKTSLTHCRIFNNSASGRISRGGGMKLWGSPIRVYNTTFYGNSAAGEGGAVQCAYTDEALFNSCIFWNNTAPSGPNVYLRYNESGVPYASVMTIKYSDVMDGQASCVVDAGCTLNYDRSNFDKDPLFANPGTDFHLLSKAGRWNPTLNAWVKDASTSACIDAGDQALKWAAELWPHGKRVNVGGYGGTPQASMSPSVVGLLCDFDNDGIVEIDDLRRMADVWLEADLLLEENTTRSGRVDLADFSLCSGQWLLTE